MTTRSQRRAEGRSERGAVLPSPVVMLSIVAVALAAVAFVVTRDEAPTEREITTVADPATSASSDATGDDSSDPDASEEPSEEPTQKKTPKPVDRAAVGVVVFNNTSISGLAAEAGTRVQEAGWNFVAADNWYGTVPATTVYFPDGMKREGRQLALDLGVARVQPADADSDMSTTNLTLILTGELG